MTAANRQASDSGNRVPHLLRILLPAFLCPFPAHAQDWTRTPIELMSFSSLLVVGILIVPALVKQLIILRDRNPERCPGCSRNDVRHSQSRYWRGLLLSVFGIASYRCRDCRLR